MDIPKPLLLADAAVRVLYCLNDTLSPQSKSYQYKPPSPQPTVDAVSASKLPSEGDNGGEGESGVSEWVDERRSVMSEFSVWVWWMSEWMSEWVSGWVSEWVEFSGCELSDGSQLVSEWMRGGWVIE